MENRNRLELDVALESDERLGLARVSIADDASDAVDAAVTAVAEADAKEKVASGRLDRNRLAKDPKSGWNGEKYE